MTAALVHVGPGERASEAAALLAATRHVHLDLGPSGGEPPPGFVRAPGGIVFWTSTDQDPPPEVEEGLAGLGDLGVELALYDVASFGIERLVDEVYFPLFVRFSYCTGEAPFKVNLDNFLRLASPGALLAVASAGGRAAGAVLLRPPSPGEPPQRGAPAPAGDASALEIVASGARAFAPLADDLLFHAALAMVSAHGFRWVWLREQVWVPPERARRFTGSARRADAIAHTPGARDCYSWCPRLLGEGEGALLLACRAPDVGLVCHVIGNDRGRFAGARQALSARGVEVIS